MNKKIIISVMLSSVLCAPYAQAMNSLLPKVRPVAQMLMNPRVRSALITQGQAVAHAAAPQTQRGLMMLAQSTVRPANQWLLNGPNLTRQLSTTTRQQAAISMKSLALKTGVVGLAYAASPATVVYADGDCSSLVVNGMASLVGVLGLYGMIYGTPEVASGFIESLEHADVAWTCRQLRFAMTLYPDFAREIAALVTIDNIMKIPVPILSVILEHSPGAAKQFTLYAMAHIETLVHDFGTMYILSSSSHRDLLQDLMDRNPDAVNEFTRGAVAHIESLLKDSVGRQFVKYLMDRNPEAAKEFTPYVVANIESMIKDIWGREFLKDVMKHNSEAAKDLTPYAVAHIESLLKDSVGRQFVKYLMDRNPEAAKEFTPYVVANIESMMSSDVGMQFLYDIMNHNPQASEQFVPYVLENFGSLVNNAEKRSILVSIANSNALARPALLAEFKKHIGDTSDVSSALTWEGMFYRFLSSESLTPTEFGLLYAAKEIAEHRKQVLKDPNIKKVVNTVIELEKKYEPTHYTFTHGRNRAYECVSTVYGALWQYAYNTPVPEDFIFTHTKDVHDPLMHKVKLHEERKLHEANINERANIAGEIRNRRLFLNTQLFGNSKVRGSSSYSYFLHSSNASGVVKVKAKDVFGQFGQQALYEKYKDEFEALEKEHTTLSEQGELLVVAVPKDRVNQDVTCMNVDGTAAPQYMINGKMTNNVQEILEARKKDPSIGDNELNFTLAMTDTAALDPKSGIKFHSVQKIDEEKYAAWQGKLDALMAKIEAEFKASWQQSLKAKERGHRDLLDAVRATQKYMSDKK